MSDWMVTFGGTYNDRGDRYVHATCSVCGEKKDLGCPPANTTVTDEEVLEAAHRVLNRHHSHEVVS